MSRGAAKDYDFSQKRHWRRWVWNRIAERALGAGVVVYLPGASDHDRHIANEKGIRAHDLIGIERSPRAIRMIREGGALVVCGDFFRSANAISDKHTVRAVFADLCCGLTSSSRRGVFSLIAHPKLEQAVFAFNFLRGRETDIDSVRNLARWHDQKHRGYLLFQAILNCVCIAQREHAVEASERYEKSPEEILQLLALEVFNNAAPAFNTYKSDCGQVFDSVVMSNPMRSFSGFWSHPDMAQHSASLWRHGTDYAATKRRVAAVMAHRTMRANATGPYR
jgi:hypothetical protein